MLELASGSSITCQESRFCCADGYYKWVAWSSAPFPAEGLAYAVLRDIDKRKLDEQALRQSNARLANVLDSMTDAFFSVDREWRLIYVNPEAERLLMHQRADLLGRNFWEVFPEAVDGPFYRLYDQVMRTGTPGHLEESSPHPPLNRWFEVHAYPIEEGLSVYFRDATERRASEERITRALQEKEVLLREVHHRVKNNLQVIYSMLRLQAGYVHDEQLLRVLGDCRERVRAMALLHDQLHRAKDLSSINLAEYIKSLAASLFCSYGVQSSKIGLRMNLEEIAVAIDTAIPCGLIVNELVSNSLRHAFPGSATGHVSLGLRAQRGGQVELTVGDDGRGFSHNADTADGPSLGLRLVSLLAAQVEAEVVRSNSAGTHYRFVFKPLKSKESE
jgi:PAS domain S-box-containing protein